MTMTMYPPDEPDGMTWQEVKDFLDHMRETCMDDRQALKLKVRELRSRDEESRRLLEDAGGWLKSVVIPDSLDYDRRKDGLATLIEEIRQHLKREGRSDG